MRTSRGQENLPPPGRFPATGGFCCLVASTQLPSSALRQLSPSVLLAFAPSDERNAACQQHAATHATERDLPVSAVKEVKQARFAPLKLGYPFLQRQLFLELGVFVIDFDISPVHRRPTDGIGEPPMLVGEAHVQLHQMVLSHFKKLELDRCRVVPLRPVYLEELLEPFRDRLRRLRSVGLLAGEETLLVLFMDYFVRLIVFIKPRVGAIVHIL